MKGFVTFLLMLTCLFAKVDFAQMSNEELIALIGYVLPENKQELEKELEKRKATFTEDEKQKYEEAKNKTP